MLKKEGGIEFFEIELIGLPPSVNQLYSTIGKFRVKSKEGTTYLKYVWSKIRKDLAQYFEEEYFDKQRNRAIKVEFYFYRPSWRCVTPGKKHQFIKRDVDNFIKAAQDSVMGALSLDDSAIVELVAKKISGSEKEWTRVRLWFLGEGW